MMQNPVCLMFKLRKKSFRELLAKSFKGVTGKNRGFQLDWPRDYIVFFHQWPSPNYNVASAHDAIGKTLSKVAF